MNVKLITRRNVLAGVAFFSLANKHALRTALLEMLRYFPENIVILLAGIGADLFLLVADPVRGGYGLFVSASIHVSSLAILSFCMVRFLSIVGIRALDKDFIAMDDGTGEITVRLPSRGELWGFSRALKNPNAR